MNFVSCQLGMQSKSIVGYRLHLLMLALYASHLNNLPPVTCTHLTLSDTEFWVMVSSITMTVYCIFFQFMCCLHHLFLIWNNCSNVEWINVSCKIQIDMFVHGVVFRNVAVRLIQFRPSVRPTTQPLTCWDAWLLIPLLWSWSLPQILPPSPPPLPAPIHLTEHTNLQLMNPSLSCQLYHTALFLPRLLHLCDIIIFTVDSCADCGFWNCVQWLIQLQLFRLAQHRIEYRWLIVTMILRLMTEMCTTYSKKWHHCDHLYFAFCAKISCCSEQFLSSVCSPFVYSHVNQMHFLLTLIKTAS